MSQDRSDRPRRVFALRHIPRAVAAICTYADPADPMAVSLTRFDAMREKAGWGNCPTAKALCSRTQKTWAELKRHAIDGDLNLSRSAGAQGYVDAEFTAEQVPYALRMVHGRLATRAGVDAAEFVLERTAYEGEVLALAHRRGSPISLPNVQHIKRLTGLSFGEARAEAGLPEPDPEAVAVPLTRVQILELCLEEHGALPTSVEAQTFAEVNGISVSADKRGRALILAELRSGRDARGLWTPPGPPLGKDRPAYHEPTGVDYGVPRRRDRSWTFEEVIAAAVQFLIWIDGPDTPVTARPTQTWWRQWAAEDPDRLPVNAPMRSKLGYAGVIAAASDRLLESHQREQHEETSWQRDHQVLRRLILDEADPELLAILTYVSQHEDVRRTELVRLLKLRVSKVETRIRRLARLQALEEAGDKTLSLGPTVVGAVATALAMQPQIDRVERPRKGMRAGTKLPRSADHHITDIDLKVLAACHTLAAQQGAFLASEVQAAADLDRELTYYRLKRLTRAGKLIKEQIPTDEQRGNVEYRWRLAEAVEGDELAA